jgi:hypothetical protein
MTQEEHKDYIAAEIIVEAYNDEEVNTAWYYFFVENLEFPINAVAKLKRRNGEWEEEEILLVEVASEPDKDLTFGFIITMKGYVFSISLTQLLSLDTSEENLDKLNHWLAWSNLPLLKNVEL